MSFYFQISKDDQFHNKPVFQLIVQKKTAYPMRPILGIGHCNAWLQLDLSHCFALLWVSFLSKLPDTVKRCSMPTNPFEILNHFVRSSQKINKFMLILDNGNVAVEFHFCFRRKTTFFPQFFKKPSISSKPASFESRHCFRPPCSCLSCSVLVCERFGGNPLSLFVLCCGRSDHDAKEMLLHPSHKTRFDPMNG